MLSNSLMTVLNSSLDKLVDAGFYTSLGIDKPTNLSHLALHDCVDHGMTFNGGVLPTTLVGEMFALANFNARQLGKLKQKYPEGNVTPETFDELKETIWDSLLEFPVIENGEAVDVEDLSEHYDSLPLDSIYKYYLKACEWWEDNPLTLEICEFV